MPKTNSKIPNSIRGVCGEHYVASFLSGAGMIVALTGRGVPKTDLLVTSCAGGPSASVQVKTGGVHSHRVFKRNTRNNNWGWRVGASRGSVTVSPTHWYAFVFAGNWPLDGITPEVFIVPSKTVAKVMAEKDVSEGFFVMWEYEAERYRGRDGLELLRRRLI